MQNSTFKLNENFKVNLEILTHRPVPELDPVLLTEDVTPNNTLGIHTPPISYPLPTQDPHILGGSLCGVEGHPWNIPR